MTFKPAHPPKVREHMIGIRVDTETHTKVKRLAKKSNLSIGEFARQAMIYSIESMEASDAKAN